jgi:hypothetical protein
MKGEVMKLYKTKTFWAGVATVIAAAAAYFTGEASMAQAAQMGATGLLAILLRSGVLKAQQPVVRSQDGAGPLADIE